MRTRTLVSTALTLAVVAGSSGLGAAGAASAGTGTSTTSDNVVRVQVGPGARVLEVRLLGSEALSSNDDKNGDAEAFSILSPFTVYSGTNPVSQQINFSAGDHEARQPGGASRVDITSGVLSHPAAGPLVPNTPTLPAGWVVTGERKLGVLEAAASGNDVSSKIEAGTGTVGLLSGLVAIGGITSKLGTAGSTSATDATRSVAVPSASVLDLSTLLNSIGIPLQNLPASTVAALTDQLKLVVEGLPAGGSTLSAYITQLQNAITDLNAQAATAAAGLLTTDPLATTTTLLGGLNVSVPNTGDPVADVTGAVNSLNATIGSLLQKALTALDGASLLSVKDVAVGITTKATDTLAGTTAAVTGKVGAVAVGNVPVLANLDLVAGTDAVNKATADATAAVRGVLSTINPSLASLVKVSVLDRSTSTKSEGGYNKADASITAVTATVTPPADLAAVIGGFTAANGVAATIGALTGTNGVAAPTLIGAVYALATAALPAAAKPVGGLMGAGGVVKVADIRSSSEFRPAVAPTTPVAEELPRTGGNDTLPLLAFGMLLLSLGYGLTQWVRMNLHRS